MAVTPASRSVLLFAVVLAAGGIAAMILRDRLHPKPAVVGTIRNAELASRPTTIGFSKSEIPPRSYGEVLSKHFPDAPTTQPLGRTLLMRDAGHFVLPHRVHLDRRGVLWITREDALPTDEALVAAAR